MLLNPFEQKKTLQKPSTRSCSTLLHCLLFFCTEFNTLSIHFHLLVVTLLETTCASSVGRIRSTGCLFSICQELSVVWVFLQSSPSTVKIDIPVAPFLEWPSSECKINSFFAGSSFYMNLLASKVSTPRVLSTVLLIQVLTLSLLF